MSFYNNLDEVMKNYSAHGGFLTVKNNDLVNTMTVSWGFVGFFWNKPYFIVGVRPQRYTYTLIEKADNFTISVPFGKMLDELKICGTKSGIDIDKSKVVNFTSAQKVESPIVKGCDAYYECKISIASDLLKSIVPKEINEVMYKNNDHHKIYFGEIICNY